VLDGVDLILRRMESRPEEFINNDSLYIAAIVGVAPSLNQEEIKALKAGLKEAHRSYFTGEVMRIIAGGRPEATIGEARPTIMEILNKFDKGEDPK